MKIQVTPHTIQIIRDTDINAGEYNVSKCTFEFSNEYQELSNVAVFTNCEGTCVEQAITNNECIIPYEMLENPGQVKLGVYGYEVEEETLVLRYSPTAQYFNVKNGSYAEGEQPTPPSPSIVEQLQAQITDNRNDINDLQEDVGNIKEDITELQGDVSNLEQTKADKSEIPTKVSQLDNDSGYIDKNVDDLTNYTPTNELSAVATSGSYNDLEDKPDLSVYATTQSLNDEISNRRIADNNLQGQIDAITSSSDVKDIVGTYQELLEYDTSTLGNDDIIKVLEDNTHNDAMTYYRWVISGSSGSWEYIGQEGPYYTKSQSNDLLSAKVGFTDYATNSTGGVIKTSTSTGTSVSSNGILQSVTRTYANYQNDGSSLIISKGTLENVITGKELTNKTYVDNGDSVLENELSLANEEIDRLKLVYNALPKVTGEGESVTLNDTAECPMEIKIKPSELYQETTTGKNLFNLSNFEPNNSAFTFTNTNGLLDLKATGTTGAQYIREVLSGFDSSKTYMFSMKAKKINKGTGSNSYIRATIAGSNDGTTFVSINSIGESNPVINQEYSKTQVLTGYSYYRIYLYNNIATPVDVGEETQYYNLQIEEGSQATSYEPYTNGASPNPDYPQEIHSISGDNEIKVEGKNLAKSTFDTKLRMTGSGANRTVSSANGNTSQIVKVKPNTTYTCSGDFSTLPNNYIRIGYFNSYPEVNSVSTNFAYSQSPFTFTTEASTNYIMLFNSNNVDTTISNLQLEKGSQATTYTPYQSTTYPINLPVENLLQTDTIDFNVSTYNITLGKDLEIGTYTLSGANITATSGQFVLYGIDENNTQDTLLANKNWTGVGEGYSFTTTKKYVSLKMYTNIAVKGNLQLEKGTKANTYTPFGTTPIEYCKIGDYKDEFIRNSGKNLVSSKISSYAIGSNGRFASNSDYDMHIAQVIQGKTYTATTNDSQFVAGFFTELPTINSTSYNGSRIVQNEKTFTAPITGYVVFRSLAGYTTPMLNEGTSALPYEPYGNGDWYLEKKIGKTLVTIGSVVTYQEKTAGVYPFGGKINSANSGLYCNKAKWVNRSLVNANTNECYDNASNVVFVGTSTDTLTSLKEKFDGSDLYYILATPTYTKIEGTLESQLNALSGAKSYTGQTNISQNNNDLPFTLSLSAIRDLSTL